MTVTNVLFEIGLEEMPARFLNDAKEQLESKTDAWLKELRLPYKDLKAYVTPRRLAIVITEIADKQPDIEEEVKGPAKKIALDKEGNWSKAAIGFSKGQGKSVDDIYFKEIKGIEYVHVNKFIKGQPTSELLPAFKDVFLSLTFPKNMRWSNLNLRFIRPIRWIVALQGSEVLPIEIAGVHSSNTTKGHRFLGQDIVLNDASEYQEKLKSQFVIVDPKLREEMIVQGIKNIEQENYWQISIDADLLNEVKHLVEYPTVFHGSFSEEFLVVPEEALITSMKEHQRYFPVKSSTDKLLPHFVAVRNGDENHIDMVAKGNEKVLKARLSDARFFYEEDQKQTIDQNIEKLGRMVFQESLGTIADKVARVVRITKNISDLINVDNQTANNAVRAAEISKFDLVTHMVNEFTELQGIMGERYASLFGENERVATAINEHYMPRHSKDNLPSTREGAIVSVADKLDTIVGCLSVGIIPSGSQDPYALRRQALGILQIVNDQRWNINLESLFEITQDIYESLDVNTISRAEIKANLNEFFKARAIFLMKELKVDHDAVDAVLTGGIGNYAFAIDKALLLTEKRLDESFKNVQEALVRTINLSEKGTDKGVNEGLFENLQEEKLYKKYQEISGPFEAALEKHKHKEAIEILSELAKPIHDFFDNTMVMTENEQVKANRLSLLNKIATLIFKFADLTKIQWKQQK
ncbi:glycine--tRNA ligase subunit beta [Aquibacillus rhizosphaerae]|uniref:Glycine--tRNA ligase beta subunit n=1 Tax=Aquibacillus rhizosphaerae TaxID=3051431 RepID=A0ABT7L6M4_9BACI|nr:glycine--tRNA ligase subunit beta [Aquibacillus sp. LR5S19]MDL4841512.1 glycine--tRNA ligase subunit beta [Aquibacillus sp. LR5S19]